MSSKTKTLNRYALLAALAMALGPLAALSLGSQAADTQAAGTEAAETVTAAQSPTLKG